MSDNEKIVVTKEMNEVCEIIKLDPYYTENREKAKIKKQELEKWYNNNCKLMDNDLDEYSFWMPERMAISRLIFNLNEYITKGE